MHFIFLNATVLRSRLNSMLNAKPVANVLGLLQTIHYDTGIVVWQIENDGEPSCNDRND